MNSQPPDAPQPPQTPPDARKEGSPTAAPHLSPDGLFYWNGREWVVAPPRSGAQRAGKAPGALTIGGGVAIGCIAAPILIGVAIVALIPLGNGTSPSATVPPSQHGPPRGPGPVAGARSGR